MAITRQNDEFVGIGIGEGDNKKTYATAHWTYKKGYVFEDPNIKVKKPTCEATITPIHPIKEEILEVFFRSVDPFDYDGQFIDKGRSYTLAFYYRDKDEKILFEEFLAKKSKELNQQIAIAVEPFKTFYKAEEYHQKYSEKHPEEYEKELIESGRKK